MTNFYTLPRELRQHILYLSLIPLINDEIIFTALDGMEPPDFQTDQQCQRLKDAFPEVPEEPEEIIFVLCKVADTIKDVNYSLGMDT